LPPDGRRDHRQQPDRRHRQEKAAAHLHGERRPDVVAQAVFGDERREERRVGHHRHAPAHGEREERPQRAAEREAGGRRAAGADDHRPGGHARLAEAVGDDAGADAAGGPARDRDEGHERPGPRAVAGRRERGNPGPHRVELPHVPEVADRREAHLAIGEDAANGARIERRRGREMGAVPHDADDEQAPGQRARRRGDHHRAPRHVHRHRLQQMGKRGADRQRADDDAERRPTPARKPAGRDLHAGGVDPGERRAGGEAEQDHLGRIVGADHGSIGRRARRAAEREEPAGVQDVREVDERAQQRPAHEAALDGHRQPGGLAPGERSLRHDCRSGGRRREPERHAEELGERQGGEHPPGPRVRRGGKLRGRGHGAHTGAGRTTRKTSTTVQWSASTASGWCGRRDSRNRSDDRCSADNARCGCCVRVDRLRATTRIGRR